MPLHSVKVYPSTATPPREQQLAWKMAQMAVDPVPIEADVADMIINRIIDNASVAMAAINRGPVANARSQALAHPATGGAAVFGLGPEERFDPAWAAWANGTAVRELDFHDTFLAADYAHPGDNIPPLLAVAQNCGLDGDALMRGIATAYEIQISLVTGICLHAHRIDHVAHLGPAAAAGIGTMLGLSPEIIYQAIGQALHVCCSTRQSRKGEISSWKAYAPAHAGKLAIEAVDRAMRGEGAPAPIYEGEDSILAWMLDGPGAKYSVPLPGPGEPKRAILDSFTKAHSAEYQAQALIDLASRMTGQIDDLGKIEEITIATSHHTHNVIGTGAGDPQKMDPKASRETLDHSIMYIFAVALEDRGWHHVESYAPERAGRPETVALWHKIQTEEDEEWTRRYHSTDPAEKAFGGSVSIKFQDGTELTDEMAVADAHPLGAKPFARADYVGKFRTLCQGQIEEAEQERFLAAAQALDGLTAAELGGLNVQMEPARLINRTADERGIFRC